VEEKFNLEDFSISEKFLLLLIMLKQNIPLLFRHLKELSIGSQEFHGLFILTKTTGVLNKFKLRYISLEIPELTGFFFCALGYYSFSRFHWSDG